MRDLDLFADYLTRLRQEKLQLGHAQALVTTDIPARQLLNIQITAHEAELCTRIRDALKVLANDTGKFVEEFLK